MHEGKVQSSRRRSIARAAPSSAGRGRQAGRGSSIRICGECDNSEIALHGEISSAE